MKKTRVKLIVKEFYKQMNPDMWDGSGERPDSFDTHAWEYPLTDAVHLELAFGYDESDGGWKYFCDLVYGIIEEYALSEKMYLSWNTKQIIEQ